MQWGVCHMEGNHFNQLPEGFVLTDLLRSEFVEYLEEHFKDQIRVWKQSISKLGFGMIK